VGVGGGGPGVNTQARGGKSAKLAAGRALAVSCSQEGGGGGARVLFLSVVEEGGGAVGGGSSNSPMASNGGSNCRCLGGVGGRKQA